jgi:hypothetical protein
VSGAAFALCPLCVARDLGSCDDDYPGGAGMLCTILQLPYVLGAPASIIGSELPRARLRPFALPRPDKPCSYQDDQGRGILRRVPAFIMLALLAALFPTSYFYNAALALLQQRRVGDERATHPSPPTSRNQSRNLPTSKRAVKALQRTLTTLNHQGVRLGRQ